MAKSITLRGVVRTLLLLSAPLCGALGCGVGFDSAAQLEGLRVLGVRKSAPYAHPGQDVNLRLFYHDDVEEPRDVQVLWLRGCQNPPADLVQVCFEVFSELLKQAEDVPPPPRGEPSEEDLAALITSLQAVFSPEGPALGAIPEEAANAAGFGTFAFGLGETFDLRVEEDIITSRPPPPDPKLPPYGIEYVFSATCAGQLWLDPSADFPIGCYDEDGVRVTPDRYVVSYTKLWVYNNHENGNPIITGVEVDGRNLASNEFCLNEACATIPPGSDVEENCAARAHVDACKDDEDVFTCPELPFKILVDEDSVETDSVLSSLQETPVTEQMWVNYYADRGAFTFDLALVNDTQSGFNDDPATKFLAPEAPGIANLWAVVHDNRGGVDWARFQVCVDEP